MRRALAVLVLVLAGVLTGCGGATTGQAPVADVHVDDPDGLHGVLLPRPYAAAHVRLEDTAGTPYDLATDPRTPLTLVFFGYTHCPDVCQVVMADIASALVRLEPAQRRRVAMVFVTTDPARDTRAVLRRYLDRFDPAFEGLTGPLAGVVRAGRAFGVPIEKGARLPSGGYDVAHGTQVVGLLPDGTAPYVWTEGTDPADLAADLRTILDDKVPGR